MAKRTQWMGLACAIGLLLGVSLSTSGQDMGKAAEYYNQAAKTVRNDPSHALEGLEKCMEIVGAVDTPEAKSLRERCNKLYPQAYYMKAGQLYGKKDFKESLRIMEQAKDAALKVNDDKFAKRVDNTITQIYFQLALQAQQGASYDEAIGFAQKALASNGNFIDAYVLAAQCLDSLKLRDSMLSTITQGLETARRTANVKRQIDLKVLATNFLKAEAKAYYDAKQNEQVVASLTQALEFDDRDAAVYQTIATSEFELKHYEKALEHCEKALEYAGVGVDKTPVYFLEGQCYQALGRKGEACKAYRNIEGGEFFKAAQHQIKEVLKCQ